MQGTVAGVGARGALLHIDVQGAQGRVYTVACQVELAEFSWDDSSASVTVRNAMLRL